MPVKSVVPPSSSVRVPQVWHPVSASGSGEPQRRHLGIAIVTLRTPDRTHPFHRRWAALPDGRYRP